MAETTFRTRTYSAVDQDVVTLPLAIPERVWSKFERVDGHWLWTGAINSGGYGHVRVGGAVHSAHRVMYELIVGPIPAGLYIDHLCGVRNCVNPAHLEPVTNQENVVRGATGQRTHCPQGHPYDAENTRMYQGRRYCKACSRVAGRRSREKKARTR